MSAIYQRLSTLSFTRPSGTEEERKAANFLANEITSIGFKPEIEEFSYERNIPVTATLEAVLEDGSTKVFPVTGLIDSAPTPPEGSEAEFFYLKSFDEVSLSKIQGKIVLLHDRLSHEEYRRLRKAGIAAYITTSGTVRDTYENSDLETGRFRDNLHDLGAVPAFTIRLIDAVALLRLQPKKLRYTLRLETQSLISQNIVVTVPGTEIPEETLIVGAHYDSVPFSKGAWDNGAGAVQVVSLLEHLRDRPPRRTVTAILFGSEETGLRGSSSYCFQHQATLSSVKAMINVDVGGSILGKEIIFVTATEQTEVWVQSLLKEIGYAAVTTLKVMSSDSAEFSDYGIPSISMGQGAPRGGGYMHTRYDNMDLIVPQVLEAEAGWLATLVDRLTDAVVFPVPRSIPEKLRKDLIDYFGKRRSIMATLPPSEEDKPLPFRF